ncbi:hypothetical protein [Virgisporangium aurantiacum]|uniref:Uncharacterized protein n=1 Tax=Virgisporangium aurantiacum TaxID=175570 RepID=A0A8J4E837_9ACTN|nr:hypothetical protein [Virgisporangium aurantiacum]GIJ64843.1 hypothetical protein Vau01_123590 [Virgisporangium aurantiacum]
MPEHTDPLRFPLQHHLDAITAETGWFIEPDALDPTLAMFGDLVTALIDAAARHAAATHLWHLLDGPLTFLLEVIGDGPIDTHEPDLLQLTELVRLRERVRAQREQATHDIADACDALNTVGLTAPTTDDLPSQPPQGQADRDATVLAALAEAGFLAVLTEHRATTRRYQLAVGGDTVHADLVADGGLTLHSTGSDSHPNWQITADRTVPARLLAALVGGSSQLSPPSR